MYNLRAIAGTLVELRAEADGRQHAGPPFEMPYTLVLPRSERGRWTLHRDLLEAAAVLIDALRPLASPSGREYLAALSESDAVALVQVERILGAGALSGAAA
jgi:hypothetical protein